MNISDILPPVRSQAIEKSQTIKKEQHTVTSNTTTITDAITLSGKAQDILKAQRADNAHDATKRPSNTSEGTLPLATHAIPSWYAEYGFDMSTQLGASANNFAEKYPEAAAASKEERNEYSGLVRKHYRSLMDKYGINNTQTHYQELIVNKGSSEALRQEMADLVRGDARLMELMDMLGKRIS